MNGTAFFNDGHTEAITYYKVVDNRRVIFTTETGTYYFLHPDFYREIVTAFGYSYTGGVDIETDYLRVPEIVRIEIAYQTTNGTENE